MINNGLEGALVFILLVLGGTAIVSIHYKRENERLRRGIQGNNYLEIEDIEEQLNKINLNIIGSKLTKLEKGDELKEIILISKHGKAMRMELEWD